MNNAPAQSHDYEKKLKRELAKQNASWGFGILIFCTIGIIGQFMPGSENVMEHFIAGAMIGTGLLCYGLLQFKK